MHESRGRRAWLLLLLGSLTMFGALSTDMYLPAFPDVADDFGIRTADVQLTLTSFMIGMGMGQVLYGPLSDRFGRKPPLFFGIVLFIVSSLACAASGSLPVLIFWRFVQGISASAGIVIDRWERTEARSGIRNGSRSRVLSTTAGDLELKIPKLRTGTFFPSLLERRRRIDQAMFAVVMEAYLHGVSTRKVDDLVKALGADTGISKSEVSRICAELDTEVSAFRDRPLGDITFPYVFVDATYCKARVNHRVVSQAVVIATGVTVDGKREVLGFDVGDSEDGAFWTAFLRSLKARGLTGVHLVISDAHEGLKGAIAAMESFFALLQKNVLNTRRWNTREELRIAILTWIERDYHRRRRQAGLGRLTPIEYETIRTAALAA